MPLPVTPASALQSDRNVHVPVLATGHRIPLIFGRTRVKGRVIAQHFNARTNTYTISVLWGLGPQSDMGTIYVEGEELPAEATVNTYSGTANQPVDPLMQAALGPTYRDNLCFEYNGVAVCCAYSVIRFTTSQFSTFPSRYEADCGGLPDTYNPVRAVQFVLTSPLFGVGKRTGESFLEAIVYNNELLDSGNRRRSMGLVLYEPRRVIEFMDQMQSYCGGWFYESGGLVEILLDRKRDAVQIVTENDWIPGTFSTAVRRPDQVPNVVRVFYTDSEDGDIQELPATALSRDVLDGKVQPIETKVHMPGITNYAQAKREALERYRKLNRNRYYTFTGSDTLLNLNIGDHVEIDSEKIRVDVHVTNRPAVRGDGRITIECQEFSDADYTEVVTERPDWIGDSYSESDVVDDLTHRPAQGSISVARRGAQARATWVLPEDDGGETITAVELIYHRVSEIEPLSRIEFEASITNHTTNNLMGDSRYVFLVRFKNIHGWGEISRPQHFESV